MAERDGKEGGQKQKRTSGEISERNPNQMKKPIKMPS